MDCRKIALNSSLILAPRFALFCWVLFWVLCLALLDSEDAFAEAKSCREPIALAEYVARSDMIVVVEILKKELSANPITILLESQAPVKVSRLEVKFGDLLKRSFVSGFNPSSRQSIQVAPYFLTRNAPSKALAFLQYRGGNSWVALGCGVLPIDDSGDVHKACENISDLFGHDHYLRERRCLLATPGLVSQTEFYGEINRVKQNASRYSGYAEIAHVFPWARSQAFQRVSFRFRTRDIKKLILSKFREPEMQVMGYYPTELISQKLFEQKLHRGRRVKIEATWFDGNLVIDSAKF